MALVSEVTFQQICEALGYSDKSGLVLKDAHPPDEDHYKTWIRTLTKFGLDALFFIQTQASSPPVPIIYFKKLEKYDSAIVSQIHKEIWNQGRIPLLFVILPGEAKIYNCFETPPMFEREHLDNEKRLIKYLKTFVNIEDIRKQLSSFTYDQLSSGAFWRDKQKVFNLNNRADIFLLNNLRNAKKLLKERGLETKYIHRLIARSILTLCLEDRGALHQFFKEFKQNRYSGFRDLKTKDEVYKVFQAINERFDGDVFPVTPEEITAVSEKHLAIIRQFLLGTDPQTLQSRLLPYRFDIIPIEFISNIYEEFFHSEARSEERGVAKREELGTHYTPQSVVTFMLNDVVQWKSDIAFPKVLDPSCGSGIFLVEAYRKIIEQRISGNNTIDVGELKRILLESIIGVDVNREAICMAAFSLYLTMLDYIPLDSLWQPKLFPKLIDITLFPVDFFDDKEKFNHMTFDVVIGNVPWVSLGKNAKTRAESYCKLIHKPMGDRQIAHAFIWKAMNLATDNAEVCLIVGAKSLLFNRGNTSTLFREQLLKDADIRTIINLSALRKEIFHKSVGPAAIIAYKRKVSVDPRPSISYVSPKASLEAKYVGAINIEKSDYSLIPVSLALEDDTIWKISMWGTPRDLLLISRIRNFSCIGKIIEEKQWEIGDGFQRQGADRKKNSASWLLDLPYLPAIDLEKYRVPEKSLKRTFDPYFHRPRTKKRFTAPLCLLKVTLKDGDIVSAFSERDIAYTDGIIGISGKPSDMELLKIICCYLNSEVAKYLLFLTCSVWGVERDDILKDDLMKLPIMLPTKESSEYEQLVSMYDAVCQLPSEFEMQDYKRRINEIFFNLFNLEPSERDLIKSTIQYTIDRFQKAQSSIASEPVVIDMLKTYAEKSLEVLGSLTVRSEMGFLSRIYSGNRQLKVVIFQLDKRNLEPLIEIEENSQDLNNALNDLSFRLQYQPDQGLLRKVTRIYDGKKIFVIKPNERRYWTLIEAYKDSDEIVSDILETWREHSSTQKMNTVA